MKPAAAIVEALQKIAERPWVYDQIQIAAGQRKILEWMSRRIEPIRPQTVVDVGGGTGASRMLWPADCRYICLDIEMPKLKGFRTRVPAGLAVLSDATRMPIASASIDAIICMLMVHHLSDQIFDQVLNEAIRVLRPDGHLILLDPVLNRERWAGRLLWRLDRGSYPRLAEALRKKLEEKFKITYWEKFTVYHEYFFAIAVRL